MSTPTLPGMGDQPEWVGMTGEEFIASQAGREPAEPLEFWVPGKAQTAGSKAAITKNADGSMRAKPLIVDSGNRPDKKAWRTDIRDACKAAMEAQRRAMWDGAAAIDAFFLFVRHRPSEHLRTGRHAGVVKDWALGLRPVKMPDLLKTARAAEDALQGVAYANDSTIVDETLCKAFGDQVGLSVYDEGLYVCLRRSGMLPPRAERLRQLHSAAMLGGVPDRDPTGGAS